jgi:Xaa-Pro dipeptidase
MVSRRSFLQGTATTAAVSIIPARSAQAATTTADVPAPIAALPSFAGRVKPFTNDERLARIEKAKKLMSANKIDAIVLANSTSNSVYFANIRLGGGERLWALVMPTKSKPFIVCPAFENRRAHEMLSTGPFAGDADVITWQEDESPFLALVKGLNDRGVISGSVGLDENMKWVFANSLMKAVPHLKFVSANPVTAGCRMIKEEHEVECIRVAGAATLAVYAAVYRSLKEGMTSAEVRGLVAQGYAKVGLAGEASMNIDAYTASPHGSRMPQTIREGSILMLDDGCRVEGYTSDITRTFVLGKPTGKMNQVFDIVHLAQQAGVKAAKPGMLLGEVDHAARKVIVDAGYGPGFKYFTHRLGHGVGLDMHEWPYLVDNDMFGDDLHPVLKSNIVMSDEPGIYIPGEFGIRLEDELHVTEDGAELLTPPSPSLEDPFGNI